MKQTLFRCGTRALSLWIVSLLAMCMSQAQTTQRSRLGSRPIETVQPASATASGDNYLIQLVSVHGSKTWFSPLGDDLMTLSGTACAPDVGCQPFAVGPFRMRSGQTLFPVGKDGKATEIVRFPTSAKGNVEIQFDLHITHPQHFRNVRKALQEFAQLQGATVSTIAAAGPGADAATSADMGGGEAGQALAVVAKIMSQDQAANALGNLYAEVGLAVGRVACGGRNPLTINLGNRHTLTQAELSGLVNKKFKLISFHKGAQAKTCEREIVYDPIDAYLVRQ